MLIRPDARAYGGVKAEHPLLGPRRPGDRRDGRHVRGRAHQLPVHVQPAVAHTEDGRGDLPRAGPRPTCSASPARRRRGSGASGGTVYGTGVRGSVSAPAADAEAAALLAVQRLFPPGALSASQLRGRVTEEEARRWIDDTGAACGFATGHRMRAGREDRDRHDARATPASGTAEPAPPSAAAAPAPMRIPEEAEPAGGRGPSGAPRGRPRGRARGRSRGGSWTGSGAHAWISSLDARTRAAGSPTTRTA
jgi:hypothetical protein